MKISTFMRTTMCAILIGCFAAAQAKDITITYKEGLTFAIYAINTTEGIAKLKGFYDGTKEVKKFEVPKTITYKSGSKTYKLTVTKIGDNAFGGAECTEVVLPNTIVEIGDHAFFGMKKANIPSKVETIGSHAYEGVPFDNLKIPATCRHIAFGAFLDCKIGSLTFGGGDTPLTIDQAAFMKATVTSVVFPARLKKIDERAFHNCAKLQYVTFEGPVATIPVQCFEGCASLKYVSMVNGTAHIYGWAFSGCVSLTDFPWYPSLHEIGSHAFEGCALTSANFFEGLKYIGKEAFRGNASLKYVSFPSTLQSIDKECFYGCEALEEVASYAVTPPEVIIPSFPVCAPNVPITVPVGSVAAYMAADGWKRFDYRHYASSIEEVEVAPDTDAAVVRWYDLQGRPVDADRLGTGIYLKVTGSKVEKVVRK